MKFCRYVGSLVCSGICVSFWCWFILVCMGVLMRMLLVFIRMFCRFRMVSVRCCLMSLRC